MTPAERDAVEWKAWKEGYDCGVEGLHRYQIYRIARRTVRLQNWAAEMFGRLPFVVYRVYFRLRYGISIMEFHRRIWAICKAASEASRDAQAERYARIEKEELVRAGKN